ncbi:MAG TPA: flagellar motor switch protein FliM [Vicinamibacterales bacterium]
MGKILSQQEIDALLGSAAALEALEDDDPAPSKPYITYNFRRPDRVSKNQIRSLHFMHDRFARNIAQSLSAYLRAVTDVSIVSVEQFNYSEFLMSLPDPTAFYAIALQPFDALGALELSPSVAFTMIDRMLGGNGSTTMPARGLTEIEQNVIDAVVRLLLESLTELWKPIGGLKFSIHARETRPQLVQVSAPNEIFILLVFDVRVGEARGMLNLALPASVIEALGPSFSQGWQRTRRDQSEQDRARLLENIGRIPLPVAATLDATLTARDLLQLAPGDVIALDRPVSKPLDIKVGGLSKFAGRLTKVAHSAAVEIQGDEQPAVLEEVA